MAKVCTPKAGTATTRAKTLSTAYKELESTKEAQESAGVSIFVRQSAGLFWAMLHAEHSTPKGAYNNKRTVHVLNRTACYQVSHDYLFGTS